MGEELNQSLQMLAERGTPRGADAVLHEARAEAAGKHELGRPTWRRGVVVASGTAAAVLALVGATLLLLRPISGEEGPSAITGSTFVPPTVSVTVPFDTGSSGSLNDINDLALAPNGDLWAATAEGAVRWELSTGDFEIHTEATGVPGRSIVSIGIAPDGTVWVAGDQGIGRYDGTWQVFSGEETPELAGQITTLAVDHGGVVWVAVASEPLARFDGSWSSVTTAQGPGRSVVGPAGLAVGTDGTLWVGTHDEGIFSFDGATWRHFAEPHVPERTTYLAVAPDGAVWGWDGGYYTDETYSEYVPGTGFARYDGNTWTRYTVDNGLLSNEGYLAVTEDGSVAAVHRQWGPDHEEILLGISRFNGDGWTTESAADGALYGPIGAIAVSADGTVWMPSVTGIQGSRGTDTVELAVPMDLADPPVASWSAVPDPEQAPIRVSTAIGDFEFTSMKPSPGKDLFHVAATPFGAVIRADGSLHWSDDYLTWDGANLGRDQRWLTFDGPDLIGFGAGFTRYTWDGEGWVEGATVDLPGPVQDIAFGPGGAVAVIDSAVYYSTDGLNFAPAASGPIEVSSGTGLCSEAAPPIAGDGLGSILVTDAGYVVLGSADATWESRAAQLCEPLAWFSADGSVWELRTAESPFGPNAAVWDIAAYQGRFVAIGGRWDEPATNVWVSDNGIDWRHTEVPQLESVLGVAGGELGWFLSGNGAVAGDGPAAEMWFSADGMTWDGPYEAPGGLLWVYFRDEPSVGADAIFSVNGTHDGIVIGRLEE